MLIVVCVTFESVEKSFNNNAPREDPTEAPLTKNKANGGESQ